MKKIFFLFLFLLPPLLEAGTATLNLHPREGELGDTFQLSVTISGSLDGDVEIPSIKDLEVLSSGTSTSMSWINGKYSKETAYNFILEPYKEGSYTIPSMKLKIDDEWVHTKQIQFKVRAAGAVPPPSSQGGSAQDEESRSNPYLFIERSFSNSSPYIGEPIVVTTKLYHRVDLQGVENRSEKVSGARVLDIKQDNSQEERGGDLYNVIVIQQTLLPLRSGVLEIPPFRVKAAMLLPTKKRRRSRGFDSFFDDFFSRGQVTEKMVSSKAAELKVRDIPQIGRPKNYNGLVGVFRVLSHLNPKSLKAGDTSTLTVSVDGVGALDAFHSLDVDFGADLRVYPDKPELEEQASASHGLESKRTFKLALVPAKEGDYDLGSIEIPYFDYKEKAFKTLKTDLGTLTVRGGTPVSVSSAQTLPPLSTAAKSVQTLGSDLVDIHRTWDAADHSLSQKDFRRAAWILGFPTLLCLILLILNFLKKRSGMSRSKRRKEALKALENILRESSKSSEHLEMAYQAYKQYLGAKFDVHASGLTAKEIRSLLSKYKVPSELLERVESLCNTIEQAQYAGGALSEEKISKLRASMKSLAREIEHQC